MPPTLLPEALRPWVEDVTERMNVPIEMVAVPMVVAASALVSRTLRIRPKRRDDWTAVPNLWGCIVGRPAMLKTPAMAQALAPLRCVEDRLRREFEAERQTRDFHRKMLGIEITRLEKQAKTAKGNPEDFRAQLEEKYLALKAIDVSEPRRSTNDPTTEKLGELLRDHGPLLLVRDELIGWLKNLDKHGREGDRQFYLEAWNGDSPFTSDRIGRGTIHIPRHCISIFGTATPSALGGYVRAAMSDGAGADGLTQRLQMLVWPDDLPPFANVDREPNVEARRSACAVFEALDALESSTVGVAGDTDEGLHYLRFDDAAQAVFDDWRAMLERRLRDEFTDEPALEAHIAKYRSLMPSLALVFHLIGVAANLTTSERVGEFDASLAADWCGFLEVHARKLYAEGGLLAAARSLAERIEDGEIVSGMTVREIYRKGWKGLSSFECADQALRVLEDAHWLVVKRVTGHVAGRPGSPRVILHPSLSPSEEAG